jgi:hypothetical protein
VTAFAVALVAAGGIGGAIQAALMDRWGERVGSQSRPVDRRCGRAAPLTRAAPKKRSLGGRPIASAEGASPERKAKRARD